MKVLVINCGSSSLKYQLIDMDGEKVLCKGLCERIGMESSMITHEGNGNKATTPAIFPTHTEAFTEVVKKMTTGEGKVIDSVSDYCFLISSATCFEVTLPKSLPPCPAFEIGRASCRERV